MSEEHNNQKMSNSESKDITNDKNENELNESEDEMKEEVKPLVNKVLIRESLVTTAVSFLLNPRVIDSPLTQKRTFLLKKGLSLEEIDLAIDRANALRLSPTQTQHSVISNSDTQRLISDSTPPPMPQPMPSFLNRSTNFMTSVALLSGVIYGAYVLYKRFIEPVLFQEKEPQKHPFVTIQEQLNQLSNAMTLLQTNVSTIESNIKKQIELELISLRSPQEVTLHELKTELSSIKALLLNRRQFAATPIPSIPLWQLQLDSNDANKDSVNKITKLNSDSIEQMNGSVSNSDSSEENHNSSTDINSINESNGNSAVNGIVEPIICD